jgi:hypothetical protein
MKKALLLSLIAVTVLLIGCGPSREESQPETVTNRFIDPFVFGMLTPTTNGKNITDFSS